MPFAAYFNPPKFDARASEEGLYVVTPSVDGEPGAMREHNFGSIVQHEHPRGLPRPSPAAGCRERHPSLARLLIDAPEFVEGWAMYCEQMMREEGFDTTRRAPADDAHRRHLAGLPDHP